MRKLMLDSICILYTYTRCQLIGNVAFEAFELRFFFWRCNSTRIRGLYIQPAELTISVILHRNFFQEHFINAVHVKHIKDQQATAWQVGVKLKSKCTYYNKKFQKKDYSGVPILVSNNEGKSSRYLNRCFFLYYLDSFSEV